MNYNHYNAICEQFTDFSAPDMDKEYLCSYNGTFYETASRITYLMKLVLMINNPNSIHMIKQLLQTDKTSINDKNSNGYDALMIAVHSYRFHNSLELVKLLIDSGANVNTRNNCYLRTVELLLQSEYCIDCELLKLLVNNGAYINDFIYMTSIPLLTSMFINYNFDNVFEVADILIAGGANTDIVNPHGLNIISYMFHPINITKIVYNDLFLNKIKYLISKRVDVNGGYRSCSGPLVLLCDRTFRELLRRIDVIEMKNHVVKDVLSVPLPKLCKTDIVKFVNFLIENGVNVNTCDENVSALTLACSNNEYELAKLLIDNGADVNFVNPNGSTVLTKSVSTVKNVDIVKLLIDKGTVVNFVDNHHNTALMNASSANNLSVVKYLISVGADVNIYVDQNCTTVGNSCKNGAFDTLRYLLENTDIKFNVSTKYGETPLILLCKNRYFQQDEIDVLKSIILRCDTNLKDCDGNTAYEYFYKANKTNRFIELDEHTLNIFKPLF